jgi:predicted dehydrogenase
MPKRKVLLVGCGAIASAHLKAWKKISDYQVSAVADTNFTLAKNTATDWRIKSYYSSMQEALKRENIEVVDICTPPVSHSSLSIQAMKEGCSVVLEKPLTMTAKEAYDILQCKKATGKKVGVINNWLFEPCVMQADKMIKNGDLGEIISMEIEAPMTPTDSMTANEHHWSQNEKGGRFSELLVHPIYLFRNFLGKDAKPIDLQLTKRGSYPWMKFDELSTTFKAGNKLGQAYISANAPINAIFLSLYGQGGVLKMELYSANSQYYPAERPMSKMNRAFFITKLAGRRIKSKVSRSLESALKQRQSAHYIFIKKFCESLGDDTEPPVTIEEAYEQTEILEQMCQTIEEL